MSEKLSQVIFSWEHPAYIRYPKDRRWYIVSAVVLAALVIWSVLPGKWFGDGNYLFAVFLVLFYLTILMFEYRPVEVIKTIVTPDGIKYGHHFHFYPVFHSFYIIYQDQGVKALYLEFRNPLRGRLVVPLDGQDPVAIRQYLLGFVTEDLEREAEPLTERLRRRLKL